MTKTKIQVSSATDIGTLNEDGHTTIVGYENSIIEVSADLDMDGAKLVMQESSTIVFNGGMLTNVTYSGYMNFKTIQNQIFDATVSFAEGTILNVPYIRPEWFGAKGIYNYSENQHTGIDDSAAINLAISVAEQLSIKIVKFNAANYYLGSKLQISKGNIWLEGSGALLREELDDGVAGKVESTTSTLVINTDIACIECTQDVAAPIYIKDLQLWSDKRDSNDAYQRAGTGVDFKAAYRKSTWPVIFERCRFSNFSKAFHLNSQLDTAYPINFLKFCDCSFWNNDYCVYFDKAASSNTERQRTWAFEFIDNRCHANNKILQIRVDKGLCRIDNNNCEGTHGTADDYALDVELAYKAHAIIEHNHFENNNTQLIKLVSVTDAECKASVRFNNTDGVASSRKRSYFKNLTLVTNMIAQAENCIFQNPAYNVSCILNGNTTALTQSPGSRALCDVDSDFDEQLITSTNHVPKKIIETPFGKKCMSLFQYTSRNTTDIINQWCHYNSQKPWMNIEMLMCKKALKGALTRFGMSVLYHKSDGSSSTSTNIPIPLFNATVNGFYRVRVQVQLDDITSCDSIYLHFFSTTNKSRYKMGDEELLGCRRIIFTKNPLDLNFDLLSKEDMEINASQGSFKDQYILSKGDQFKSGKFDILCLQSGNLLSDQTFHKTTEDYISSDEVVPVGSLWTYQNKTIKILGMKSYSSEDKAIENGNKPQYYTTELEFLKADTATDKVFTCLEPVLLGHGCGTTAERNVPIATKLCPGSTYFDTTLNKMLHLNNSLQWVE